MRKHILEAAVRVFAEGGSRHATTRRIAQEAGCNEVTVFRQFGSKEKLIREALLQTSSQTPVIFLPDMPEDPERELEAWAEAQLTFLYENRSLIRTSLAEFEMSPDLCRFISEASIRVAQDLRRYLEELTERGFLGTTPDVEAASSLLMGAIFTDAISRDIVPERYPYPLRDAARTYVRMFLSALGGVRS